MEQEGGKSPYILKRKVLGNRWKWEGRNFLPYSQISNRSKTFFSFLFIYGFVNGKKATTR